MLDFSGREAVVTGGTGALGAAVVGRLLEAGATVHVPVYIADELEGFAYRGHQACNHRVDGTKFFTTSVAPILFP